MRLWVDGQCFQSGSRTRGIGRYVTELLAAVAASGEVELIIALNSAMPQEAIAARAWLAQQLPSAQIVSWQGTSLAGEAESSNSWDRLTDAALLARHVTAWAPDLALSPSPFEGFSDRCSPLIDTAGISCPVACIFHDAIPHRFAERFQPGRPWSVAYYRRLLGLRHFDVVLCNSNFTASEYRDLIGKRNHVTLGAGLPGAFRKALAAPFDKVDSFGDYVLYVGGLDWHKNLALLIAALARLPGFATGASKLVIGGAHAEAELAPNRAQWASLGLPRQGLVASGWISDATLVSLYRGALVTVQPSLMEGFGLTALEAMAAGGAMLAARNGATAEVVGNPSLLFDPADVDELGRLIVRMIDDAPFRAEAISFGLERAKTFDWADPAKIFLAVAQRLRRPAAAPAPAAVGRLIIDVTGLVLGRDESAELLIKRDLIAALAADDVGNHRPVILAFASGEAEFQRIDTLELRAMRFVLDERVLPRAGDVVLINADRPAPFRQRDNLVAALANGVQVIQSIVDLDLLLRPACAEPDEVARFCEQLNFSLGHASAVICGSPTTAGELLAVIQAIELPRPLRLGHVMPGPAAAMAAQLRELVRGEGWTYDYAPAERSPAVLCSNIGCVTQRTVLGPSARQHRIESLDGPHISAANSELVFTIALHNDSAEAWFAEGERPGLGMVLSAEFPDLTPALVAALPLVEASFPFVLPAGLCAVLSVRVPLTTICAGARTLLLRLGQSAGGWAGPELRLDLTQLDSRLPLRTGDSQAIMIGGPLNVPHDRDGHLLLAIFVESPSSHELFCGASPVSAIWLADARGVEIGLCTLAGCRERIDGQGWYLADVTFPRQDYARASELVIAWAEPRDGELRLQLDSVLAAFRGVAGDACRIMPPPLQARHADHRGCPAKLEDATDICRGSD